MGAYKESLEVPADAAAKRPCCGVYVQQVNRITRLADQIQVWMKEEHPASIRVLRTALQRKERMEKWLAAHTHEAVPAPDWRSDVEMAERTQVHLGLGPRDAFE